MPTIDRKIAHEIIEDYHAAWSRGDVTNMMACCHDDVQLLLNSGAADGGPLHLNGKIELTNFLAPISKIAKSTTIPELLSFDDGLARTRVSAKVVHLGTKHVLTGTYRQLILFDGNKISDLNEFHDAAMMKAFWALVENELAARKT